MLTNYLKVAFRSIRRQPGYAGLNIAGLALGIACSFLIVLFIRHELSYDRFHEKADRIYRLLPVDGEEGPRANTPAGLAPDLADALPDIEAFVRLQFLGGPYLGVEGGEHQRVQGGALADPSFFEVFSFPLLRGDPETALEDPHSLVLTESAARALFGNEDPLGKTVIQGDDFPLRVTGVMEDVPANSHVQFNYLGSFNVLRLWRGEEALSNYTNSNYRTYLLLKPGTDAKTLAQHATELIHSRFGEDAWSGEYQLQPLPEIHFTTDIRFETAIVRNVNYIYVFAAIAFLVLLIACVNFTNLSTARAVKRAKEVGVRKTAGAQREQLAFQFVAESVVMSLLAVGLAFLLVQLLLPSFNALTGVERGWETVEAGLAVRHLDVVALLLGIGVLAGLLAGSYPAFYLSAFNPARVLKGEMTHGQRGKWLQKGLIVFQFIAAIALIVGTATVFNQLRYMQTQDLGFDKEHVVFFQMPDPGLERFDAFKQEVINSPNVLGMALGFPPGRVLTFRGYNWPGAGDEEGDSFWSIVAGPDYLETMGLDLKAGRGFVSEADSLDAYILNETAVRALGVEDPVGSPFRAWDHPMGRIVGVVEDFHFQSLHQPIEPVVINYLPGWTNTVSVRTAPGTLRDALNDVETGWKRFAPGYAFDYEFLDEDFERAYRADGRLMQLLGFFAAIAILIACLGLFGLAAYAAETRTKEIGIRKVLGASVPGIVALLSKDFLKLVLVAFVIAAPIAYLAMRRWLENFAYHIDLGVGVFLLAGLLAVVIALLTVSYQAVRAALADPVKSLRYE